MQKALVKVATFLMIIGAFLLSPFYLLWLLGGYIADDFNYRRYEKRNSKQ